MAKNPADDVPAPSVQDNVVMHTGAMCPADGTLVTCSGYRDDHFLSGRCPVCQRVVYADAQLVSQTGFFGGAPEKPQALVDTADEEEPTHGSDRETAEGRA